MKAISWEFEKPNCVIQCYQMFSKVVIRCYHVNTTKIRDVIQNTEKCYQMLSVVIIVWVETFWGKIKIYEFKMTVFLIAMFFLLTHARFWMQRLNGFFISKDVWSICFTLVLFFLYPYPAMVKKQYSMFWSFWVGWKRVSVEETFVEQNFPSMQCSLRISI